MTLDHPGELDLDPKAEVGEEECPTFDKPMTLVQLGTAEQNTKIDDIANE